jgi:hypothetical protein
MIGILRATVPVGAAALLALEDVGLLRAVFAELAVPLPPSLALAPAAGEDMQ